MRTISVIIPVYNTEPYMSRCARSLFGQTLLDDIEFLFIDECVLNHSFDVHAYKALYIKAVSQGYDIVSYNYRIGNNT